MDLSARMPEFSRQSHDENPADLPHACRCRAGGRPTQRAVPHGRRPEQLPRLLRRSAGEDAEPRQARRARRALRARLLHVPALRPEPQLDAHRSLSQQPRASCTTRRSSGRRSPRTSACRRPSAIRATSPHASANSITTMCRDRSAPTVTTIPPRGNSR